MKNIINKNNILDIDTYLFFKSFEKEWKSKIPKYTTKEVLEIFPEARFFLDEKINEWEIERQKAVSRIKEKIRIVIDNTDDNFDRWFWKKWVEITEIPQLNWIEKRISKLKRIRFIAEGKKQNNNFITEEDIKNAKNISIAELAENYFSIKQISNRFVALCPFHQDSSPSFYLYPDTNSFYCYGCNLGGDVIKLKMLLDEIPFQEAVRQLNNK